MDDIPYIIVDNQRIPPIQPSHRSPRTAGDGSPKQEDAFGVVDRVTLSSEGLRRSREQQDDADEAPAIEHTAPAGRRGPPLLTYSPRMLR